MIAGLHGTLAEKDPDRIVIDVNGVYYEVFVSLSTLSDLPEAGEQTELICHTYVREDILALYGFSSKLEKELFLSLISVSGIGPKQAGSILSGLAPADLAQAVVNEDVAGLTRIPGVGKKKAERLILDLKEKLQKRLMLEKEDIPSIGGRFTCQGDLVAALESLGYKRKQIHRVIETLSESHEKNTPVENLIRHALQELQ